MTTATVTTLTSKGQTTIPKVIRDELGIKAGDNLAFTLLSDGTIIIRVKNKSLKDLAGTLHKKGRKSIPTDRMSPWA